MRAFLFFQVMVIAFTAYGQPEVNVPSAEEMLNPAFRKAAAENKNVFLIFQASWCGWCRKLDASLLDSAVAPLITGQYEIVHLTVHEAPGKKHLENKGALAFLEKHNADMGLPYWYILDKNGTVLADSRNADAKNTGCPATAEEVNYFRDVLKNTSSLTDEEIDRIARRFRKNE